MKSFNEVDQKLMAKMVEKYAENVPTCRQDFSEDVFKSAENDEDPRPRTLLN